MLGKFKIVTVSHKSTPTEKIKYFLVPKTGEDLYADLFRFKEEMGFDELLYLNTCNRGMYMVHSNLSLKETEECIERFLVDYHGDRFDEVKDSIISLEGKEAVEHYMSVAASMDSMVIGEREIFRQIRDAYDESMHHKLTGDHLRLVQQQTVKAAKRIYTDSKIAEKPVSIVSLAMKKFEEAELEKDAKILLIGAGTIIETVTKFLKNAGFLNVTIFNRTQERAEALAQTISAQSKGLGLRLLEDHRGGFDAIFTCTSAPKNIVTKSLYKKLLGEDHGHKVLVDLSIPQDIDEHIYEEFDVTRIILRDLKDLAKQNHAQRQKELVKAKGILQEEIKSFSELIHRRFIERSFSGLPEEIKKIREKAVNEVFISEIEALDPEALATLHRVLDYMEKKCIAVPMRTAKEQYIRLKSGLTADQAHK